jgi:hypothetical protein
MRRTIALVMIALSCALLTDDRAIAPGAPSILSVVLRVADPAMLVHGDYIVSIRIGPRGPAASSTGHRGELNLSQCFEQWREAARDALFKQLRMA